MNHAGCSVICQASLSFSLASYRGESSDGVAQVASLILGFSSSSEVVRLQADGCESTMLQYAAEFDEARKLHERVCNSTAGGHYEHNEVLFTLLRTARTLLRATLA